MRHSRPGAIAIDTLRTPTDTDIEIVPLGSQDLDNASGVVAAAFFDYPMFTFYFPSPSRRARHLPWYLRNVLRCALRYGDVLTTPEIAGVLFALPPGHTSLSIWEYVQNGFLLTPLVLGLGCYRRSMQCERFVDRTQNEIMGDLPHYYLWGAAVDPERQGEGIGSALMHAQLERVDAERMPVYLETHDRRNVGYYERYGFELVLEASIPKHGLPIWCMCRPARAGNA